MSNHCKELRHSSSSFFFLFSFHQAHRPHSYHGNLNCTTATTQGWPGSAAADIRHSSHPASPHPTQETQCGFWTTPGYRYKHLCDTCSIYPVILVTLYSDWHLVLISTLVNCSRIVFSRVLWYPQASDALSLCCSVFTFWKYSNFHVINDPSSSRSSHFPPFQVLVSVSHRRLQLPSNLLSRLPLHRPHRSQLSPPTCSRHRLHRSISSSSWSSSRPS